MKMTIKTPDDLRAEAKAAKQEVARSESFAYLDSTDWLVVRHAETGKEIPADVLKKRQAARDVLSS